MLLNSNEFFGENAGKVYEFLSANPKVTIVEIKKLIKISDKEVAYGLGWLAKEGKIEVEKVGRKVLFSIK